MNRTIFYVMLGLFAAALGLGVASTRRDLSEPHIRLFSDMVKSPANRSQGASSVFKNRRVLQSPPAGTIARGDEPIRLDSTPEGRNLAGKELKNPFSPTFEAMTKGKEVFGDYCLHCHGPAGRGDGPVARAATELSFPIATKSTLDLADGEIFHIISEGRNNMPAHESQISQEDRWKLIHYLRDLQHAEMDRLGPLAEFGEDPRRLGMVSASYGKELFTANCAGCHGKDGKKPNPGVPTLNSPAVLAIADDEYYADIINHGRKGTQMPSWSEILTKTQILSITKHIRSWATPELDPSLILASKGNLRRGRALFRGHCSVCHGVQGEGGIGNSLNRPSFQAIASDQFLRDTIMLGRKHTSMPAAYDFSESDLSDIIAHIRSWNPRRHSYRSVMRLLPGASVRTGAKVFEARCASCHGHDGEGGIGSRLSSDSFLSMADDTFLYRAISEGRPGTAMPAWGHLEARDVADVMAFMRAWQRSPFRRPGKARRPGNAEFGKIIYKQGCVSCHGDEGQGGAGGQTGNKVFLHSASDEFLWRTIAYGKDGTAMRGFLEGGPGGALMPMDAEDIDHLVAYLRLLEKTPRLEPLKKPFFGASAAAGQEIFEGKGGCAKCHGIEGEGASGPSLTNSAFLKAASNGFIAGTVILGRDGTQMRSYYRDGNVHLDQKDVEDVAVYLRTFENKTVDRIRRVNASASTLSEGRELFSKFCASCHGSEGRGPANNRMNGYAPSLNNQEFLSAAGDNFLLATIALGRPGTPMRAFAKGGSGIADLSAHDIEKIVSFIRSWEEKK